jgi:4'-phosphopantetheinyl transferase
MRVDGLNELAVSPWWDVLDADEQAQAARFVFSRDRVTFIAAHVLVRVVLSRMMDTTSPRAWRFVADTHGKPVAWLGDQPAPISFNLSHTAGMVGVAAVGSAGCALGFDLETLDRMVPLEIAAHYFCPQELIWLESLPDPARREGFLRLWTLKEAFIKATGKGLSQDLTTFWFAPTPPRIHFTAALAERTKNWHFEQRVIRERFIAALGFRQPIDEPIAAEWLEIDPDGLS